ncbi:hypothetical protein L7F22_038132 [Adiantum nelumboides]|nr:hypothetical protein [Adiantum nelumboides]
MNEEAHDAAQGMIGEIFVLKADRPLYCGSEILAREEEFLLTGVVPKDIEKPKKYGFLRRAYKYKLIEDVLYMLGANLVLRRVPWKEELYEVLEENHEGACGGHFALKITLHKIMQEGYVWPSLQKDVYHWCRSCKRCQSFGKRVLTPELRKTILAYDVFEKWGIDAVGPLPITSRGKNYILTAVDYLSRWGEAKAVRQITAKDVAKFVYEEICCKFGVPLELLSDQGPGFRAELLDILCEKMKITCKFTTPYYPQCNGLNERFNSELVQILSKVTEHQGKNWDLEGLKQQEAEPIDDYIKKFSLLWKSLCQALQPQGAPPDMMKKDRFLAGLKENLRWRVELKKPRTYEDTLEVARNKEWKIKRLTQLGVSSLPGMLEMKQANFVQSRVQEEVHHTHVIRVVAPVVPPIVTPIQDDGLRQDMRQVVDLMKNLSLNLLSNAGNHHGQGRQFNQTNNNGG